MSFWCRLGTWTGSLPSRLRERLQQSPGRQSHGERQSVDLQFDYSRMGQRSRQCGKSSQKCFDREHYRKRCALWLWQRQRYRRLEGESLQESSVVYAEEYLHGVLDKLKFRATKVVPNGLIQYRFLFRFSLSAPGNSLVIGPKHIVFSSCPSFSSPPFPSDGFSGRDGWLIDAQSRTRLTIRPGHRSHTPSLPLAASRAPRRRSSYVSPSRAVNRPDVSDSRTPPKGLGADEFQRIGPRFPPRNLPGQGQGASEAKDAVYYHWEPLFPRFVQLGAEDC